MNQFSLDSKKEPGVSAPQHDPMLTDASKRENEHPLDSEQANEQKVLVPHKFCLHALAEEI